MKARISHDSITTIFHLKWHFDTHFFIKYCNILSQVVLDSSCKSLFPLRTDFSFPASLFFKFKCAASYLLLRSQLWRRQEAAAHARCGRLRLAELKKNPREMKWFGLNWCFSRVQCARECWGSTLGDVVDILSCGKCWKCVLFFLHIETEPAYECPGQSQPPAPILSEHRYSHFTPGRFTNVKKEETPETTDVLCVCVCVSQWSTGHRYGFMVASWERKPTKWSSNKAK